MLNLRTLQNADIKNKKILYRAPYDVGTKKVDGDFQIKDDSRIIATLPTLEYLLKNGCSIVILTYVKRPNGYDPSISTKPHAEALQRVLEANGIHGIRVTHVNECIGQKVSEHVENLKSGEILMLENSRFHKEDYEDNDQFAKELTKGCDFIVFDAFPQAHRATSSTVGIFRHLNSCAGFYFEKELNALTGLLDNPSHPFTLIIGGAKISDKVGAIINLYNKVDKVLVGGASANPLLAMRGHKMGNSLIEEVNFPKNLLDKIILPTDLVCGESVDTQGPPTVREVTDGVSKTKMALDIGPNTVRKYLNVIEKSKTVFWAGPMGAFENDLFANGTKEIALALSNFNGTTIVAGGDTIGALNKFGNPSKITHISLAGGATLEFLAGQKLPVVEMLKEEVK